MHGEALSDGGAGSAAAGGAVAALLPGALGPAALMGGVGLLAGVLAKRSAKAQRRRMERMIRRRGNTAEDLASDAAQSAVDDAKRGLRVSYGDIDGGLIDRGMYNTTVRDSLRSGATSDLARVVGQIRGRQADRVSQVYNSGYDQIIGNEPDESAIPGQVGQLAYLALQRMPTAKSEQLNQDDRGPGGVGNQVAGDVERQMGLAGMSGLAGPMAGRNMALARMYLNGRQNPGGD